MKAVDKIYCHTERPGLSVGKLYTLYYVNISGDYYILDDMHSRDYYSFDKYNDWYYRKWFYTEKNLRKEKIKKLNNESW
jgi:hypothetical protein